MNVIDRKQAADLLQVSVRTVDRYIQRGVLPKEEVGGRIVIKYQDLKPLLEQKRLEHEYLSSLNSNSAKRPEKGIEPPVIIRPPKELKPEQEEEKVSTPISASVTYSSSNQDNDDSQIYKKLYEELQEELKTKQERLEGANYRVGQLEGLLKESIPLIDYRKSLALEEQKRQEIEELLHNFEKDNDTLNQTIEAKKIELTQISQKLDQEKFNKKVFLIILIILFLLQPLWLLFPPVLT